MNDFEILSQLFRKYKGETPDTIVSLQGGGSGRRYYRLSVASDNGPDCWSCIGVVGANHRDYRSFIGLSEVFRKHCIPVPEIYTVSEDTGSYLQQDLGTVSFFDIIRKEGESERVADLMEMSVRNLARLQSIPEDEWINIVEYPSFGERQIKWDLNYFKYEYLLPSGIEFCEDALEEDLLHLTSELNSESKDDAGFMYRDCQSRNIMVFEDECWWIDFQGGRMGPGIYDLVSLVWQAKASFSKAFRTRMIDVYLEEKEILSRNKREADQSAFREMVMKFAFFRTLQVLGAYGLRGLVERKAHFIESIPFALLNLRELIESGVADKYPELKQVCERICNDKRFAKIGRSGLRIEVFSFSYKRGYPADFSGNGGGFMFDCRGMHNPGRYPEYKQLTGRDLPVIEFLESRGEVQSFVENAYALIKDTIKTYMRRGFTNLQVGFGCRGGQPRSVYCAERFARVLRERFPEVDVCLVHREHPVG